MAAPTEGENAVRLAGKPDAAAVRPVTRGRAALGDVSNQQRVAVPGAKPAVRYDNWSGTASIEPSIRLLSTSTWAHLHAYLPRRLSPRPSVSLLSMQASSRSAAPVAAPVEPTLAERGIVDIDAMDVDNEHAVADYVGQIYSNFRATEASCMVRHAILHGLHVLY